MTVRRDRGATQATRFLAGFFGIVALALSAFLGIGWTLCLDTPTKGGWECQNWGWAFALIGAPAGVIGIPLTLGAFVPLATLRRALISFAVALPTAAPAALIAYLVSVAVSATGDDWPWLLTLWAVLFVTAFAFIFRLVYRATH